jgi:hypothetical protein
MPLTFWLIRNHVMYDSVMGSRPPSPYNLHQIVIYATDTISTWFIPSRLPLFIRATLLIGMMLLLLLSIWHFSAQQQHAWGGDISLVLLNSYMVSYSLALIYSAATTAFDPLNDHLLSPLYTPLTIVAALSIDKIQTRLCTHDLPFRQMRGAISTGALAIMVVLSMLWLVYPAYGALRTVALAYRLGAGGYASAQWQESELIAFLRSHQSQVSSTVWSNDPYAVYLLTGLPAKLSPRRFEYNSPKAVVQDLEDFRLKVNTTRPWYLIWFSNINIPFLYDISYISSICDLKPVHTFSDGVIYLVVMCY